MIWQLLFAAAFAGSLAGAISGWLVAGRRISPAVRDLDCGGEVPPRPGPDIDLVRREQAIRRMRTGEDLRTIAGALGYSRPEIDLLRKVDVIASAVL